MRCDPVYRFALNEQLVDLSDDLRFLRHDLRQTIRPLAVPEEGFVRQRDLSVRKAFALAPCDVFGNGAALLLGKARHNGDQQFTLAVKGVNTLFLEIDLSAVFLQLADGSEAVHGISGKAADGFRDDQVDPPGQRIRNHAVKAVSVTGVRCGNAFVRVHVHELPIRIRADEFGVIIYLRLV